MVKRTLVPASLGKRILDDWYIHRDALNSLDAPLRETIITAMASAPIAARERANVLKLNLASSKLSLLRYDGFFEEPFPILREAWSLPTGEEQSVAYRSYLNSLNPPILHRKELLLHPSHPLRSTFEEITRQAEEMGFFDETTKIGFQENWLRLVASKGYKIVGGMFVPVGNVEAEPDAQSADVLQDTQVLRHLTALSRSNLSAPMQLLLRHALISTDRAIFDYGCGKGDDVTGLSAQGYSASGWDPFYAADNAIRRAQVVNLGFVLNVIEDPNERREALHHAFSLADGVLAVAVMLAVGIMPGRSYRDGVLTTRNTFQKYFSQEEFKEYLRRELGEEVFLVGPGVGFIFKDKDLEQRFVANRYRRRDLATRVLRLPRHIVSVRSHSTRNTYERLSGEKQSLLVRLWKTTLDLGRLPERDEVDFLPDLECAVGSLRRARRIMETAFDREQLTVAAKDRTDDLRLFFAMGHFERRPPYKSLEVRLQRDIKAFFSDYRSAQAAGVQLLHEAAIPDSIRTACCAAAEQGMGWLDREGALYLHISVVDRLPVILRAYIGCGFLIYDAASEVQLIKVHSQSGKLTLLQYEEFDTSPLPLMKKRVKINIRRQDYEIFEYGGEFEKPPLYYKSRYLNEEYPGYVEQLAFDDELMQLRLFDPEGHGISACALAEQLELHRRSIQGFCLQRSGTIPALDQLCGQHFRYRDFIECGETQRDTQIENIPRQAESFNALHDLTTRILDPLIDYFGCIQLTYGFCSHALSKCINARIAPQLDQHAAYERTATGRLICERGGAACDFLVSDEDMKEVCHWIMENLPFDRLYFYGKDRPVHVSYSAQPAGLAYEMREAANGRRIPRQMSRR